MFDEPVDLVALSAHAAAIYLDPNYAFAYNNRGLVYRDQHKPDLALADYNHAIELDPNYDNPHWGIGDIYYDQGDSDKALTAYRRYLELAGDNADAFVVERVRELEAQLGTATPSP